LAILNLNAHVERTYNPAGKFPDSGLILEIWRRITAA